MHQANGTCCCFYLQLWFAPHEGLCLGLWFFKRGCGIQSTVEQICVCGDRMLHLYICCADQTFQVAHLHVHHEQCVKLAVTTPGHAMLLCGSLIITLLYYNHMPVLPCTH